MSTAPGWYPLANEPGMMGYWDGNGWTAHKQPLPPAQEAVPVSVQAPEPSLQMQGAAGQSAPASSQWLPDNLVESVKRTVLNKENQALGATAAGGALIADGIVGFGEKRQGLGGAIGTIIFGIIWLIMTMTPGMPFSNPEPRAGSVHAQATITNVQVNAKGGCSPVAELVVDGTSYTVRSSMSESPCPYMKGEKADVTYHPTDPAATATFTPSGFFKTFLTFAPWIGVLVIIGGAWTLIKRLAAIGGGIFLLRKGLRDRKAMKDAENTTA